MFHPDMFKRVWLVGIGGIGMSALARYFHRMQMPVAGYDRTPSVVTDALVAEGIEVFFSDDPELIQNSFRNRAGTLVIYTPAVPASQRQLLYFREQNFVVQKRSEVLGLITRGSEAICVAGTHGKTTISTLVAHLFRDSVNGCTAFLGGISKNFGTNFLLDEKSPFVVLEADEFDRSFLHLTPSIALVSAVDADHLDIYGDRDEVRKAFVDFALRIPQGGTLVAKAGLDITWQLNDGVELVTYSATDEADFYATNIVLKNDGTYSFSLVTPKGTINDLNMGIPGMLNVENAVGACALALLKGVKPLELTRALPVFKGIARRFDTHIKSNNLVYIDDYAHHPEEIRATLNSIRAIYHHFRLVGVFQPHLYSRTRDFAEAFGQVLSMLDELYLLDIYPAREEPIPGVDSKLIGQYIHNIPVWYGSRDQLITNLKYRSPMVLVSMGAGDIDRLVHPLTQWSKLQAGV
ncbi:UDP-N-acetylmuramate--L-alanine ligase [Geofilum sp. OHC36d9]|uniref:UDP-N-acetylmuramate--L-alanine ligase n=1 Tax=Geofilum sp. OHC36d9 TaxID=3458413 RepID=UPI0040336C8F